MAHAQPQQRPGADDPLEILIERLDSGELELPVIPEAAAEVLEACRDDENGARQVAEIMQRDPSLAGHALRLSNSAAYGGTTPIVSLSQAISRLGLSTVSEITLAVALKGRVFSVPRFDAQIRVLWVHSAGAGIWAREIARMRRRNVEGAFLCGLLHDVGRPVILQALVDIERELGRTFSDEAFEAAADDLHPAVGATLVRRWSLPDWMADAIAFHHDPAAATEHRDQVLTTALADQLAHWSLEGDDEDFEVIRTLPILEPLNLYPEDLERLLEVRERVGSAAHSFA